MSQSISSGLCNDKARQLQPTTKLGTPAKRQADLSDRSLRRVKQMRRTNVSQASSRTQLEHMQGKVCIIYSLVLADLDSFLVHFMMTYAFAREFMRVGVNPVSQTIEWAGSSFTVSMFRKILTTANNALSGRPSLYQALWGRPGDEVASSMHNHNWFLSDDAAHKQLERLVQKWMEWGVDTGVQVQLISLTSVYNGKAVAAALDACTCADQLPIQVGMPPLCPYIYPSSHLFVIYSSICLSIHTCIHFRLYVFIYLSIYPSIHLSICLFRYLSIYISI